jgi:uncharacterized protein YndB with AHSA1/START domain
MTKRKKISLEYEIKSSPNILFNYISTPSGLSEWFSDNVNVKSNHYTFFWEGEERTAEIMKKVNGKNIRLRWDDVEDEEEYFELEIKQDDITGDVALVITDFIHESDEEEIAMLWENQVNQLRAAIGAY